MITQDINLTMKEAKEAVMLPAGSWTFELLDIAPEERPTYDTRTLPKEDQVMETVLNFDFAVLNYDENDAQWRGYTRMVGFVPTYFYQGAKGKNKLWKICEALTGEDIVSAEGKGTEYLNSLIGKQLEGFVEHNTKGEKTYANIVGFTKVRSTLKTLTDEEKAEIKERRDEYEKRKLEELAGGKVVEKREEIKPEDIPF